MARSLHIQVTCAGIETRAQMDFVRGHGAKIGQGFYFSRALAWDEFAWFLEERNLAAARRRRKPAFSSGA
jgi:sensor c-di-GMP phosphodiesterase-like protein